MRSASGSSARENAFTLIELLVALAVGSAIMTATAAMARMSFQTVAIANRIAQENAMMRCGIVASLDEIDFWRSYDDPDATSAQGQRLRATIAMEDGHEPGHPIALGMPFTPLSAGWPDNSAEPRDLDPAHWSAADRRSRWRGNLMERTTGDLRSGRYAIFSNAHRTPDIGSPDTGSFGAVTVPTQRTWLASQTRGLNRALGYAGMFEYLPTNAVFCWYGEYRAPPPDPGGAGASYPWVPGASGQAPAVPWGTTNGGYDHEFVRQMRGGPGEEYLRNPFFCMLSDWNNNNFPSLDGVAFPIVPPNNAVTSSLSDTQMVHYHRWWFTLQNVFAPASTTYVPTSVLSQPLMPLSPTAWPQVTVSVQRAFAGGLVAASGVRWVSPVTGRSTEVTFSVYGTSLRGARQQRKKGGGWARPGDPTLDN